MSVIFWQVGLPAPSQAKRCPAGGAAMIGLVSAMAAGRNCCLLRRAESETNSQDVMSQTISGSWSVATGTVVRAWAVATEDPSENSRMVANRRGTELELIRLILEIPKPDVPVNPMRTRTVACCSRHRGLTLPPPPPPPPMATTPVGGVRRVCAKWLRRAGFGSRSTAIGSVTDSCGGSLR